MSRKKLPFDWSTLTRQKIIDILQPIKSLLVDIPLSQKEIRDTVNCQIKKHIPVRVSRKLNKNVSAGILYAGGMYIADYDQDGKMCIEIQIINHPADKYITLKKTDFNALCKSFADIILHEIIHMRQHRKREFAEGTAYYNANCSEDQKYLGRPDEIDAYGFNVACELLDKFKYDQSKSIDYIKKHPQRGFIKSHSLNAYLTAFDYDYNNPVIKRLIKKSMHYMPHAAKGKPFNSNCWINY